ncbi:hypothetical protein MKW98_014854 [Papaver atlanticum]|uniref:Uncharacterized protein n=1 Tax=Papaver atlanticum TaxID=357466 RepID=A0AAD4SF72_9MAGN|nr:hypothetical protein MKW98_014854 [Papaver atlanticum]
MNREGELTDDLRPQVVDELLRRRNEFDQWDLGDFDACVKRMRDPTVLRVVCAAELRGCCVAARIESVRDCRWSCYFSGATEQLLLVIEAVAMSSWWSGISEMDCISCDSEW